MGEENRLTLKGKSAEFDPRNITNDTIVEHGYGWFSNKEKWVKLPNFNEVRYYGDKQGNQKDLVAALRERLEEFRNPGFYLVRRTVELGKLYFDWKTREITDRLEQDCRSQYCGRFFYGVTEVNPNYTNEQLTNSKDYGKVEVKYINDKDKTARMRDIIAEGAYELRSFIDEELGREPHKCSLELVEMDVDVVKSMHNWRYVQCDECRETKPIHGKTWHCETCKYDNCEACHRGHKFLVGQTVARWSCKDQEHVILEVNTKGPCNDSLLPDDLWQIIGEMVQDDIVWYRLDDGNWYKEYQLKLCAKASIMRRLGTK